MDMEHKNTKQPDAPRPAWQVWAARAGVVLAILLVIAQVITIVRGGQ